MLVPGVDPAQWARAELLDGGGLGLRFAVGVHPRHDGELDALETWIERLGAVAIGELGWQQGVPHRDTFMDAQIEIARRRRLPIVVHVVGAHGHALERLRRHGELRGVVHAYSGSADLVREYLAIGLHVSIGPSVLVNDARKVHAACVAVPAERLLIETDAPDQIAEPAGLREVAVRVADLRGATFDELADLSSQNARDLFG